MRFDGREDVVEEFNKLVQHRSVEEYVEKFEEIKSLMNALNPTLPETYYISSLLGVMKDGIRPMLKILKPATLI